MGKIKVIELTEKERTALEKGHKKGSSHAFRQRCQMILIKSERRTSLEVADTKEDQRNLQLNRRGLQNKVCRNVSLTYFCLSA